MPVTTNANVPTPPNIGDTEQEKVDLKDLKRKSVRGGAVTLVSQSAKAGIQIISTVVLARLLSPDDYGLMAMVVVVTNFAGLFREMGLSSAAIQKKGLTRAQQSNLFWLNTAMGATLTAIVAAGSPLVAMFYGRPELTGVTLALSTTFIVSSLGTQHGAMLVRNMQFGRKAAAAIGGALVGLATSVALAFNGFTYWSLVWGNVSGSIVTTLLLFAFSPFRPLWFTRKVGTWEMVNYGANITGFNFINFFQRNLDNILIGRFWGSGALGLYSKAYSLLMLPITSIRNPINAVAFPALSRLQNDPDSFRSYYLKTTSLIALLSMPITAFFFVASKPIILLMLGEQWLGVSPIFSSLAVAGFIQPASGFAGSLLLSLGQGRRYFWCGTFNAVVIIVSFLIGVIWGAMGVATAYAVGTYVVLYPWLRWAYKNSPVSFSMFAKACCFPAIISIAGALAAFVLRVHVEHFNVFFQLIALASAFAVGAIPLLLFSSVGKKHTRMILGITSQFRSVDRSKPL
jgi:PST family polysaccharide transporter